MVGPEADYLSTAFGSPAIVQAVLDYADNVGGCLPAGRAQVKSSDFMRDTSFMQSKCCYVASQLCTCEFVQ